MPKRQNNARLRIQMTNVVREQHPGLGAVLVAWIPLPLQAVIEVAWTSVACRGENLFFHCTEGIQPTGAVYVSVLFPSSKDADILDK